MVSKEKESVSTSEATTENPNIGKLGDAKFQPDSLRVKGFCGEIVDDPETYLRYLTSKVLPAFYDNPSATRIIDRAVVRHELELPVEELAVPLHVEACIPLGGEWEGYDWVMIGAHLPGRQLSESTKNALVDLAEKAANFGYEAPKPLPLGYRLEQIDASISGFDLQTMADIFNAAFTDYISSLGTAEEVLAWLSGSDLLPVVVRNAEGKIVAIANGDMAEIDLNGKKFKFLEIGDSAADPAYRSMGLNRLIKHYIISRAAKLGFNSVHTETRAAWGSPNFGNAKNGMEYRGTLFLNCKITGEEDVPETADPDISEESRRMGSLNVWSITEKSPLWQQYLKEE